MILLVDQVSVNEVITFQVFLDITKGITHLLIKLFIWSFLQMLNLLYLSNDANVCFLNYPNYYFLPIYNHHFNFLDLLLNLHLQVLLNLHHLDHHLLLLYPLQIHFLLRHFIIPLLPHHLLRQSNLMTIIIILLLQSNYYHFNWLPNYLLPLLTPLPLQVIHENYENHLHLVHYVHHHDHHIQVQAYHLHRPY